MLLGEENIEMEFTNKSAGKQLPGCQSYQRFTNNKFKSIFERLVE